MKVPDEIKNMVLTNVNDAIHDSVFAWDHAVQDRTDRAIALLDEAVDDLTRAKELLVSYVK